MDFAESDACPIHTFDMDMLQRAEVMTDDVKRYDHVGYGSYMEEDTTGEWVEASEYDALKDRLAEAELNAARTATVEPGEFNVAAELFNAIEWRGEVYVRFNEHLDLITRLARCNDELIKCQNSSVDSNQTTTDDLLSCPFCGVEPCMYDDANHSKACYISCQTEGCIGEMTWHENDAEAIAAWNRRASQAAPGGCGYPCGYDCNGACFQSAPAPSDGLREAAIADALNCLDGEPEYHENGMGCGLEDRNITDRYEAMAYGWNQAMERIFAEHINPAIEALSASPAQEGSLND